MRALTVYQPWASLIAAGAKPYEFRSWRFPVGLIGDRIAIHAGARPIRQREVVGLIYALEADSDMPPCLHRDTALPVLITARDTPERLPISHVVCTAVLGPPKRGDECAGEFGILVGGNDSDRAWAFNWGWPMLDVEPVVPPAPARGAQGFWHWSP